jgi:hypothetical protein
MHKIDTNTAVDGSFVDKNASLGVDGTVVDAAWLNSVQDEISNVIEEAGETLSKQNNGQMASAIGILTKRECAKTVIASSSVKQGVSATIFRISDYFSLAPGYFIDENVFVNVTSVAQSSGSIKFSLRKNGVADPIYEIMTVSSTYQGISSTRFLQEVGDAVASGNDYYFSIDVVTNAPETYEFDIEGIVSKN